MAVQTAGTISQSVSGIVVTFTDQSTGIVNLVSRVLNIYDCNNVLLTTISMGSAVTATYDVSTDLYLTFIETIVDDSGTSTLTINYLSTTFYENTFADAVTTLGCGCNNSLFCTLEIGELFKSAALRFALSGFGVAAQRNITGANVYANGG